MESEDENIPGPSSPSYRRRTISRRNETASEQRYEKHSGTSKVDKTSNEECAERVKRKEVLDAFDIKRCEELEEADGFDQNMRDETQVRLVNGFEATNHLDGDPNDLIYPFTHAMAFSRLIKHKVVNLQDNDTTFEMNSYLDQLRNHSMNQENEFDPMILVKKMCVWMEMNTFATKPIHCITGAFDFNALVDSSNITSELQKEIGSKSRSKRINTVSNLDETGFESQVVNNSQGGESSQEVECANLRKKIFQYCKTKNVKAVNLFEFVLDVNSLGATVQNLYYVGFLIRDGYLICYHDSIRKHNPYAVFIKPAKKKHSRNLKTSKKIKTGVLSHAVAERFQFIMSFSLKQYRELCSMVLPNENGILGSSAGNKTEDVMDHQMEQEL